jgi:hypothetical protein
VDHPAKTIRTSNRRSSRDGPCAEQREPPLLRIGYLVPSRRVGGARTGVPVAQIEVNARAQQQRQASRPTGLADRLVWSTRLLEGRFSPLVGRGYL